MELLFVLYMIVNYLIHLYLEAGSVIYLYIMIPSYSIFGILVVRSMNRKRINITKKNSVAFIVNRLFFLGGIYLIAMSILGCIRLILFKIGYHGNLFELWK